MSHNFPSHLLYTKDHEWAQKTAGHTVTIGITDHAQDALGDIVFLELPPAGKQLKKGDTIGVVESIKAVSDIYSPVTGKVIEANTNLVSDPGQLNSDPYDKGWLIRVEVSDPASLDGLMNASQYTDFVATLK